MARKGINIAVASDTRQFSKGVQDGMIEPLEDVATSLEEVGRDGERAGAKLEDAMRDSQRATDKLKEEHKDLNDVISRGSKTAFKKMEHAAEESYDKAGTAAEDFKAEGKSAFGEMAGSFDGSMDSMAGSAQGFLGGLAASGGPVALAAGAIGVTAGVIYNSFKENAEKAKERVNSMYQDMSESGREYLSEAFIQKAIEGIITGSDDAVISLKQVQDIASATGLSDETVLAAAAGDAEALNIVLPKVQEGVDNARGALSDFQKTDPYADTTALDEALGKWVVMSDQIDGVTTSTDSAKKKVDLFNGALRVSRIQGPKEAADAFLTVRDAVDDVRAGVQSLPHRRDITVKLDTKDVDDEIKRLENKNITITATVKTRDGRRLP